ncbi:FKBP-type peptidyl-prolyl cis-trans isomerase [Aspergillus undulatus]|uniref:FKBP-type peptidyl-prolyl cis-trans isomerase n=1 Tax=Aspergillus undulatus TaxID=1810928 RepID=UPI003CCD6B6F
MSPPQGVTKTLITPGNGTDTPRKGDTLIIEYRGCLYDDKAQKDNFYMGTQFDTSTGRGPLKTEIGVGKVIRGWDEGVQQMTLGEKAILTISSDYGYGKRGFPGLIPPDSGLVFEVELKKIIPKAA